MLELRDAVNAEVALAHQLIDQHSPVAGAFLGAEANTTRILENAVTVYDSDAELALIDTVRVLEGGYVR